MKLSEVTYTMALTFPGCDVALFEHADRMNNDAASALLKTLEEPPSVAKLILTTAEFGRILPTVRSRCLNVACGDPGDPTENEMNRIFGGSIGLTRQVQAHQDAYERLWATLESSLTARPGAAIFLAEQTREASEGIGRALGLGARAANTETLRCVAEWLIQRRSDQPELAQHAVEAHRLIVGNVNAGALFDLLWAQILSP